MRFNNYPGKEGIDGYTLGKTSILSEQPSYTHSGIYTTTGDILSQL